MAAQQSSTPPPNPNAAPRTGAISGVVSDAATGRPVAGVVVFLGPSADGSSYRNTELTDAKGRFVFTDLPARDGYAITASKPGYAVSYYGPVSARTGGTISLAEGQWFNAANVRMIRFGSISGLVTDESGDPMPGVFVRVLSQVMAAGTPHLSAGIATKTDDRGVYRLGGLKAGNYVVNVPSVQSTVPVSALPDPHAVSDAWRIDALGFTALSTGAAAVVSVDNDTRLVIGNYATPPLGNGPKMVYPIAFFPSSPTVAGASAIELGPGEERTGVDIRMDLVPGVRITGRLDGPADTIVGQTVRLVPSGSEELGMGSEAATGLADASGAFALVNVPAGSYTIDVARRTTEFDDRFSLGMFIYVGGNLPRTPGFVMQSMSTGGTPSIATNRSGGLDTHVGRLPIVVGTRDISGVVVPMRRGATMAGSVVWDGPPPPDWGVTTLKAEPAHGSPALGVWQNQALFDVFETFTIDGLRPGEYVLRASNVRSGGIVKSVRWNDRDYTDSAFDASAGQDFTNIVVTLTIDVPVLEGTARNGRVAAGAETTVVAFPEEREQWSGYGLTPSRIQTSTVSQTGAYRFQNLPAGNYCVIAVDIRQGSAWQDPKWLEAASQAASRVTLRWGAHTVQNLTSVAIK